MRIGSITTHLLRLVLPVVLWASVAVAQETPGVEAEAVADSTVTDSTMTEPAPLPQIAAPDTWQTGVNATGAVLMTPLFPGWGQLYSDNNWRAALAFGVELYYWSSMLSWDRRAIRAREFAAQFSPEDGNYKFYNAQAEEYWERMRDFAWWSGGVLLIVALDAYVGAHLFNFDEDPLPVPNNWDEHFTDPINDMPGSTAAPSIVVFQHGWRF